MVSNFSLKEMHSGDESDEDDEDEDEDSFDEETPEKVDSEFWVLEFFFLLYLVLLLAYLINCLLWRLPRARRDLKNLLQRLPDQRRKPSLWVQEVEKQVTFCFMWEALKAVHMLWECKDKVMNLSWI